MEAVLEQLAEMASAIAGMQPTMLEQRSLRLMLKRRMAAVKMHDAEKYVRFCKDDAAEQASFLEGVLNGETSFFRDAAVFAEMERWCLEWLAANTRPLKILSAPCSSGEEPYSIVTMLVRAGVEPERIEVEALDISRAAIASAEKAVYRGFSLRNVPEPATADFLEPAGDGWRVKRELRERVSFRQANLMDDESLAGKQYDLICSRNLLLYQSAAARRSMATRLAEALAPGGRLIVGMADWGRDLDKFFVLEEPVSSFALGHRESVGLPLVSLETQVTKGEGPGAPNVVSPVVEHHEASPAAAALLADVTELYRVALEAYLRGEAKEAERLCRQTLYLEGDHVPTLELLTKVHRPHVPKRVQMALHARLKRHRAMAGGEAR